MERRHEAHPEGLKERFRDIAQGYFRQGVRESTHTVPGTDMPAQQHVIPELQKLLETGLNPDQQLERLTLRLVERNRPLTSIPMEVLESTMGRINRFIEIEHERMKEHPEHTTDIIVNGLIGMYTRVQTELMNRE